MRQNSTKIGESTQGFFTEHKKAGYVRSYALDRPEQGNRTFFDKDGRVLGEVPWRETHRPGGILNRPIATKWFYYRPVFEKSAANTWSDRVVGMITVHSTADDGDSLFKTAEFQQQVDSIATEVSPYLDAIQVLTGEEKL